MAEFIYGMCGLMAFTCTWLLIQGYLRSRYRLLLWGGLCFGILTINNILLIIDKILIPAGDLSSWRLVAALMATMIMLCGLIWDTE